LGHEIIKHGKMFLKVLKIHLKNFESLKLREKFLLELAHSMIAKQYTTV
jgi:hypothetical protein